MICRLLQQQHQRLPLSFQDCHPFRLADIAVTLAIDIVIVIAIAIDIANRQSPLSFRC